MQRPCAEGGWVSRSALPPFLQGHQITISGRAPRSLGIPLRSTFSPEAPALEQNPETRADDWAPVVTKRRRILVVEDDSEICALLSDLLTEMGHDVTCAASDKEAYGAFQRETIEALVVDINLGRGTTGSMWRASPGASIPTYRLPM